jgi:hypothetical protein
MVDKNTLKRLIASSAYNVGFGAKKHLATYDMVEKTPGWIGFISASVGIASLVWEIFSTKEISAALLILGIVSYCVGVYSSRSSEYNDVGKALTDHFRDLTWLYHSVDSSSEVSEIKKRVDEINANASEISISKQILFSDWYAHLKFFGQNQSGWVVKELNLGFWRDQVPSSLKLALYVSLVVLVTCLGWASVTQLLRGSSSG